MDTIQTNINIPELVSNEASGPKPKILVDCNAAIPNSLYLRYSFEDKGS